jgi:hypothetical protein
VLHLAAAGGHVQMVRELLRAGAETAKKNQVTAPPTSPDLRLPLIPNWMLQNGAAEYDCAVCWAMPLHGATPIVHVILRLLSPDGCFWGCAVPSTHLQVGGNVARAGTER